MGFLGYWLVCLIITEGYLYDRKDFSFGQKIALRIFSFFCVPFMIGYSLQETDHD